MMRVCLMRLVLPCRTLELIGAGRLAADRRRHFDSPSYLVARNRRAVGLAHQCPTTDCLAALVLARASSTSVCSINGGLNDNTTRCSHHAPNAVAGRAPAG